MSSVEKELVEALADDVAMDLDSEIVFEVTASWWKRWLRRMREWISKTSLMKRVGVQWFSRWRYDPPLPLGVWVFSRAHDTEGLFWRICGLEISIRSD